MASQTLSREQCLLLQRHHDRELSAAQSVQARQLLERSAAARVYMRALEELSQAVRAASEVAWRGAEGSAPSPAMLVALAEGAGELSEAPLHELAPILERFHDGEVDEVELAVVGALLDERDDAVDYLASLDELGQGMRVIGEEMAEGVDFDGFWEGIAACIEGDETTAAPIAAKPDGADEPAPQPAFDRDEHLVLLQRYVDGEVNDAERARVDRWIEAEHSEVKAYLEALAELSMGVNAAIEVAGEQADLRGIWTGVQVAITDDSGVVSLEDARDRRHEASSGATGGSWLSEYRQAIVGALAAAVVLAGLVGLFKDQLFGPQERVVVEKRVVVVEQVEYSPGSDVMIDSPMKQVSADSEAEEDPTVIWLFDSDQQAPDAEDEDGPGDAAPAQQDQDAGSFGEDAGRNSAPSGQPI